MQGYFGGSRFLLQVFKKNLKSAWLSKFCLLVGIVITQINQKLDMLIKMLELWWGSRWKVQNISWYKKLPILSNKYHWSINNVLSFIQIFCFWWDYNERVGKDMVPLVVTGKCSNNSDLYILGPIWVFTNTKMKRICSWKFRKKKLGREKESRE